MDDFVIAKNPDDSSSLPFLIRIPLPGSPVVLKAKDTWPRTSKIYCHPSTDWPASPEIVERCAVQSCRRRGAAIDLVLDRHREKRSQFVFTQARGRDMIFWQSARTNRKARPNVRTPTARAHGRSLEIAVDTSERYAWNFDKQQAQTNKRKLAAGDYAVMDGDRVVAAVERKSLQDFVSTLTAGKLWFLLAELASLDRAAVVVEERYSSIFKLDFVRPLVVLEGLGEAAVRYPTVPIHFCESRQLAQEWTYRFFGAALERDSADEVALAKVRSLPYSRDLEPAEPTTKDVRAWARSEGIDVPDRGRLRPDIWELYTKAHARNP